MRTPNHPSLFVLVLACLSLTACSALLPSAEEEDEKNLTSSQQTSNPTSTLVCDENKLNQTQQSYEIGSEGRVCTGCDIYKKHYVNRNTLTTVVYNRKCDGVKSVDTCNGGKWFLIRVEGSTQVYLCADPNIS